MPFWKKKKNQFKKYLQKRHHFEKKKKKRKEKKERKKKKNGGFASTQRHQRLLTRVSPVTSPSRRGLFCKLPPCQHPTSHCFITAHPGLCTQSQLVQTGGVDPTNFEAWCDKVHPQAKWQGELGQGRFDEGEPELKP
jgi:hypothetical protein